MWWQCVCDDFHGHLSELLYMWFIMQLAVDCWYIIFIYGTEVCAVACYIHTYVFQLNW